MTTRHVVHSALWLVVCLGTLAGCYLVLGAEFVALVQLLVYVGAVVVLVLFALMLTRAPIGRNSACARRAAPRGGRRAGRRTATTALLLVALPARRHRRVHRRGTATTQPVARPCSARGCGPSSCCRCCCSSPSSAPSPSSRVSGPAGDGSDPAGGTRRDPPRWALPPRRAPRRHRALYGVARPPQRRPRPRRRRADRSARAPVLLGERRGPAATGWTGGRCSPSSSSPSPRPRSASRSPSSSRSSGSGPRSTSPRSRAPMTPVLHAPAAPVARPGGGA